MRRIEREELRPQVVYDLEVEGCHEYFAEGLLVHNCIDAMRYICKHIIKPKGSGKGVRKISYKRK